MKKIDDFENVGEDFENIGLQLDLLVEEAKV